jgi:hypothetical protein
VSAFSAKWLALRESYDLAARNRSVLSAVAGAFRDHASVTLVDLACGTGATRRAIGVHLPGRQIWRLVDNDLGLLGQAATFQYAPNVRFLARPIDLVRDLELALEPPLDLVTTSALLDLVSPEWLDRLIVEAAARRLPVYAALSYDGRIVAEPACCIDREIIAGFNLHQRSDKGFGPALGPAAASRAASRFEYLGYQVVQGRSDWLLGPDDRAIQEALLAAWAEVAALTTALSRDSIAEWLAQRRGYLADGCSTMRVGHTDIFARPIGTR